jgi:hypothetical protein
MFRPMELDPPDDFFELTTEDLVRLQQEANRKKQVRQLGHMLSFRQLGRTLTCIVKLVSACMPQHATQCCLAL